MLIAINQDSTYPHLHASTHAKKKKIHLNFSMRSTPCMLTRRVWAFATRGAAGVQPSSGVSDPDAPASPGPAPGPTARKEVGESLSGWRGSSPPRPLVCPHQGWTLGRWLCTAKVRDPNRTPAETGRSLQLSSIWLGRRPLSEQRGSGCLHISQKQPSQTLQPKVCLFHFQT